MGLFLELGGAPADGGGNALDGDDVAEFNAELGVRRIEPAADVEPGIKRVRKPAASAVRLIARLAA